jgi:3,4-dihydroxy 2-butanone 4-phosphate synthase/GTP cyclohydrolase II
MERVIWLHSIEEALDQLKAGKTIIVVDDDSRENEGDFIALADRVTPETVNFMIKEGRGLVCMPITEERADELNLPPMTVRNTDNHGTAFTVSVDHLSTTTGISAFDRAITARELCNPASEPTDFSRPGHLFPLTAKSGGVIERPGHTEAAVDLAKLCNAYPAALICEIIKEDGTMARLPDLVQLAYKYEMVIISIKDLIHFRQEKEKQITREVEIQLPTAFGQFRVIGYSNEYDDKEHIALVKGEIEADLPVLVRIHSECLTGDVFHSQRCDCGDQLAAAMEQIEREGAGVLLYMRQEGRGIGLINKLKAYALQEQGLDTVEANIRLGFPPDARDYVVAAQMLKDLGVQQIRLLTNNPRKINALEQQGLTVIERLSLQFTANAHNEAYLRTKKRKLGHLLDLPDFCRDEDMAVRSFISFPVK